MDKRRRNRCQVETHGESSYDDERFLLSGVSIRQVPSGGHDQRSRAYQRIERTSRTIASEDSSPSPSRMTHGLADEHSVVVSFFFSCHRSNKSIRRAHATVERRCLDRAAHEQDGTMPRGGRQPFIGVNLLQDSCACVCAIASIGCLIRRF